MRIHRDISLRIPDMRQVVHLGLTAVMGWLAFTILQPTVAMSGPVWAQFIALAPEQFWGEFFAVIFAVGVGGMVLDLRFFEARFGKGLCLVLNLISTFVLGCGHILLAVGFYIGFYISFPNDPTRAPPPWIGGYIIMAGFGFYLLIRRILVAFGLAHETVLLIDLH